MKKQLLITLTLISFAARAQQNTFTKVHYDAAQQGIEEHAVCRSFDNGYMFAGVNAYSNGFIMKTDSAGNKLWNKTFHISNGGQVIINAIDRTMDSCFIIAGHTFNAITTSGEGLFGKINPSGDTLWLKSIAFTGYGITIQSIHQTFDSGYIMTGIASQTVLPYSKIIAARTDAAGNLLWAELLEGANSRNEGNSIKQMPDSSFLLAGFVENTALNETDPCFINLSDSGMVNWANKYVQPSQFPCYAYDIQFTNDGIAALVSTAGQMSLMKTDFAGNVSWTYAYSYFPGQMQGMISSLELTADSSFAFAYGTCFLEGIIIKTNVDGTLLWMDNLFLIPLNVLETPGKELFISGNGPLCAIRSNVVITPQIGIIQTDSMGTTASCNSAMTITPSALTLIASPVIIADTPGGVLNSIQPIIDSISIISYSGCVDVIGGIEENKTGSGITISPNPTTNNFTITFPNTISKGVIEIYDVMGKKIFESTIFNASQKEIRLKNIGAGIYFVKVRNGEREYCKKLVIE